MSKTKGQIQSNKQEKRITKSLNQIKQDAKKVIASGALWFAKSDVVSKLFRIEAKTKAQPTKQITIKKEWMEKIELEAFESNKLPALAFSFGDGTDYFILRDKDFYSIVEKLEGGAEE